MSSKRSKILLIVIAVLTLSLTYIGNVKAVTIEWLLNCGWNEIDYKSVDPSTVPTAVSYNVGIKLIHSLSKRKNPYIEQVKDAEAFQKWYDNRAKASGTQGINLNVTDSKGVVHTTNTNVSTVATNANPAGTIAGETVVGGQKV
jgi:hypothetical protein